MTERARKSADSQADDERLHSPSTATSEPTDPASTPFDTDGGRTRGTGWVQPPDVRVDDFTPGHDGVSRVLLLVAHSRNRSLLATWLNERTEYDCLDGLLRLREAERQDQQGGDADREWTTLTAETDTTQETRSDDAEETDGRTERGHSDDVAEATSVDPLEAEPIDLILVDVGALRAHGAWLERRIAVETPLPIPCLLLASTAERGRFFSPNRGHRWQSLVDDVVTTPVDPVVLERRLHTYLSIRRQAVALARRHDQLTLLSQVVRHDIANAATVITGWGDILRGNVTDDGTEPLERILRAGQRVVEIVENSRDLTHLIGSGHTAAATQAMLLAPVLQSEVDTIGRVNESTSRQVSVDIDSPLPTVEVVAGGMLASVFANLLSNAVRHNDADTIEIHVGVDVRPADVVVTVADNGPGIADADKDRVFQPSTKRGDSPGDGLGLSLVKRIVDSYGGSVWFEDGDDAGTVAHVALRRVL